MSEAEEIQYGWGLVRGGIKDWNGDPSLAEVEALSEEIDRFGEAWQGLCARSADDEDVPSSALTLSLRLLEARQIGTLDATRAVSMIGRPAAAGALLRSVYEGFLFVLLLASDGTPISMSLLRDGENPIVLKEEFAERFIAFGDHSRLKTVETYDDFATFDPSNEPLALDEEERGLLRASGEAARSRYGFGLRKNTWHPFKGIWQMREHLWPEGDQPRFPAYPLPIDYSHWRRMYALCYTESSHDVHGSSVSHVRHEMSREADGGFRLAQRSWSAQPLSLALHVADMTVCAISHSEGRFEAWLEEKYRCGLIGQEGSV